MMSRRRKGDACKKKIRAHSTHFSAFSVCQFVGYSHRLFFTTTSQDIYSIRYESLEMKPSRIDLFASRSFYDNVCFISFTLNETRNDGEEDRVNEKRKKKQKINKCKYIEEMLGNKLNSSLIEREKLHIK